MKALVTGAGGQLGRELVAAVPAGVELAAFDRRALDVCGPDLETTIERSRPDVVINAAAYTAVDGAESDSAAAFAVNEEAVRRLAAAAAACGARFVHVSTDFVFDGRGEGPYAPTDTAAPRSVYGRSKLAGEIAALAELSGAAIVRTSWLYSRWGRNFVTNMLRLMAERDELRVVADQVGTPTWAALLAPVLWRITESSDMAGVWHWCDGGRCSWYDFACAIRDEAADRGLLAERVPIRAVTTADFPTAAERPAMSALDASATREVLGIEAVPWRTALGRMLDDMKSAHDNDG